MKYLEAKNIKVKGNGSGGKSGGLEYKNSCKM